MDFLRASPSCAIIDRSLLFAMLYCFVSAFRSSFSAAISSGSDTIRMLRTRTASCVAAKRIRSASDDSIATRPVTAFIASLIPLVRSSAMIDSVASKDRTMPKASASRTPIRKLANTRYSWLVCRLTTLQNVLGLVRHDARHAGFDTEAHASGSKGRLECEHASNGRLASDHLEPYRWGSVVATIGAGSPGSSMRGGLLKRVGRAPLPLTGELDAQVRALRACS